MKMTTGKKRLVAVLLAVMMVLSVVPFAALAVNAETGLSINGVEIFSGQTITLQEPVTYNYGVGTPSMEVLGKKYYFAQLTEYNIDDVIVAAANYGPEQTVAIPSVPGASVYITTQASDTSDNLKKQMQEKLDAKVKEEEENKSANPNGVGKYDVSYFSTFYRNQLKSVQISYYGKEYKELYLYAKVSSHIRTFRESVYTENGNTRYCRIGKVVIYPTSLSMNLSYPSTSIAVNQTIRMVATANTPFNVDYKIVPESGYGLARVDYATGSKNVFEITANSMVTNGNRLTVYAYLKDSSNQYYIYRLNDGTLYKDKNLTYSKDGYTYTPIRDYRTVTFSTVSPITSIKFNNSFYTCEVGDSFYTGVTVLPIGATGGIAYTSADPAVAAISSSGIVTGVSEGQTYVYATSMDGSGAHAAAKITVKKATAKISISSSSMTLAKGEKATLTATVVPTTLTDKTVLWTSSNSAVASVSSKGEVTAVNEGIAVITATYARDPKKNVSCVVTVTKTQAKITVPETLSVEVGKKINLGADITNSENKTLLYSSDNTAVLKVDANGNITGVKAGNAMVTVMSAVNTSVKAYCVVTVTGESGVIKETAKYVANSKYYRSSDVSSADVKTAIAQLKDAKSIDVTVDVTSKSDMNKVVITRYAAARLAKYADSLIVKVDNKSCVFDSADLKKMDIGRPVYVYVTPDKVTVKYKNTSGVYKTIKVTPEVTEK